MRISKLMPSAVMVAGALALAGCGGGSSTTPAATTPQVTPTPPTPPTPPASPASATVGLDGKRLAAGSVDRVIKIPATGAETKIEDVYFTCTGTEACVITIPAGESVFEVSYTGGTLTASASKAPPKVAEAPEGEHWLSDRNLVSGLAADGGGIELETATGLKATVRKGMRDPVSGNMLTLNNDRGRSDTDFLIWGVWEEPPAPGSGTAGKTTRKILWAGSQPYRVDPPSTGKATYNCAGTCSGKAHGLYSLNGGAWTVWTGGNPELTADFGKGTVSGKIDLSTPIGTSAHEANRINLKETAIGTSFSGSATIHTSGSGGAGAPSSGTWEGGFFGPSDGSPTGIAGGFNVTRPAADANPNSATRNTAAVHSLSITGGFGATQETN